jgi:hypothetical protein
MAVDLLVHHAVDGKILSNKAYKIAKESGISRRTVEQAKREFNIKSGRGADNERIWIIPNNVEIIKESYLASRLPRLDLPIVYINPQEKMNVYVNLKTSQKAEKV